MSSLYVFIVFAKTLYDNITLYATKAYKKVNELELMTFALIN